MEECYLTVKELIKNADILLLSSVEEGIANVVLEAMALGTLVVSTECGGMNEVIKNNENGFLVDYVFSFKSPDCSKIVNWIEGK